MIPKLQDLNKKVKQKYPPTQVDLARHPSMHRTDTLDMFTVAYGEIYLVTDTDETLLVSCGGSASVSHPLRRTRLVQPQALRSQRSWLL